MQNRMFDSDGTSNENIDVFKHRYIENITSMSKTIIDIEKKYRYIGIENIAHVQEIFYNLFPNFEVRMTYNTRFKDKLEREQKHRHRNFISIFYTSTSIRRYQCEKHR